MSRFYIVHLLVAMVLCIAAVLLPLPVPSKVLIVVGMFCSLFGVHAAVACGACARGREKGVNAD